MAYINEGFTISGLCNRVPATRKAKVVLCTDASIPMVYEFLAPSLVIIPIKNPQHLHYAFNNSS